MIGQRAFDGRREGAHPCRDFRDNWKPGEALQKTSFDQLPRRDRKGDQRRDEDEPNDQKRRNWKRESIRAAPVGGKSKRALNSDYQGTEIEQSFGQ